MTARATDKAPTLVPVRADRRRKQPSTIDLVGTEGLDAILGDEAKSRSLSTEHPPTGKPDAGNPPVRFGGRGGALRHPYPYRLCLLSRRLLSRLARIAGSRNPFAETAKNDFLNRFTRAIMSRL
jgi:hypothetical protein